MIIGRACVLIALSIGSIGAIRPADASDSTRSFQAKVQLLAHKVASEKLLSVFNEYDKYRSDRSDLMKRLKKTGLSESDTALITKRYSPSTQDSFLKASLDDSSSIVIADQDNRIEVRPSGIWKQAILINGKRFQWNWYAKTDENLRRYDKLFVPSKRSHSQIQWPTIVTNVWADDGHLFRIKASGLQLYFMVTSIGEIGGDLYKLNDQVKEMLTLCKSPEPASVDDDPFLRAVLNGTADAQKYQGDVISFRNCKDVKSFSQTPVRLLQGDPVFPRIPTDLCTNLDSLAQCVRNQMEPAAVSDQKMKKPRDKDEWYEAPPVKPRAKSAK